ncbi:hypothetical protein CRG98_019762 [Punica granatum]|uniref:Uncharacterized protein n=1 Tax=Punica granatum TaxID=22663 RepID=A0A2I0JVH3_PUNGR|nr:hypothetical protein CRG98_019762 [Punica granatum]
MGREIVWVECPRHPESVAGCGVMRMHVLCTLQNHHLGTEEVEGIVLNFARVENSKSGCRSICKNEEVKAPAAHSITYSPLLTKTPDFSKLPNLEGLILRDCIELAEVHPSIRYLERLVSLNLRNCKKLKKIPSSICRVKSLEYMDISGCPTINQLPEDFWDIESLREFLAEGTNITRVPFSITRLKNLRNASFNVSKMPKTSSISSLVWSLVWPRGPPELRMLKSAKSLRTLRGNQFSGLPDTIKGLPKLEKLVLDDCAKLKSLPSMPPSLFVLPAVNCVSLARHCLDLDPLLFSNFQRDIKRAYELAGEPEPAGAIVHLEWCGNLMECNDLARDALENFILGSDCQKQRHGTGAYPSNRERGDDQRIRDAILGEGIGKASYAWLVHLPHQVVFRDETSFKGEVELEADSGSSSLRVEQIGIHFGSQVCRYCRFDPSTGREATVRTRTNRSAMMPSTLLREFNLFQPSSGCSFRAFQLAGSPEQFPGDFYSA